MRKRLLGLWALASMLVLAAALAAAIDYVRPHVDGRDLRFDDFVAAAEGGRVEAATILNYDSYVVGTVQLEGRPQAFRTAFLKSFDQGGINSQQPLLDLL